MTRQSSIRRLIDAIECLPASRRPATSTPVFVASELPSDWLWTELLTSFATLGNSRGADGLFEHRNWSRLKFDLLAGMEAKERAAHLETVFRDSKVRYAKRKAMQFSRNVDLVVAKGGPAAASAAALAEPGKDAKQRYVRQFVGIGPKYARNIFLDIGHPEFHESIALDSRIGSISKGLDLSFADYASHERFYLEVVAAYGTTGYQLDRCLYANHTSLLDQLQGP